MEKLTISGAQDSMASQPIGRIRSDGRARWPIANAPTTCSRWHRGHQQPDSERATASVRAYGAARPSGTTANPANQPKNTSVRRAGR